MKDDQEIFDQLHALMTARLEGSVTEEQTAALNRLLEANVQARRLYLKYINDSAALQALGDAAVVKAVRSPPATRRAHGPRWLWIALPSLVAAGVLIVATRGPGGLRPPATPSPPTAAGSAQTAPARPAQRDRPTDGVALASLQSFAGEAYLVQGGKKTPATSRRPLIAGEGVLTGRPGSLARLAFADGSQVELSAGSHAWLPAPAEAESSPVLFLAGGTLTASIAKQRADAPFVIMTPQAQATVLGTRFTLSASPRETKLSVTEGLVRLSSNNGRAQDVGPHQQAVVSDTATGSSAPAAGVVLFVVGNLNLGAGDQVIKEKLGLAGFEIVVRQGGPNITVDPRATLIVVSSTVASGDVGTQLRDIPIGLVTWEEGLFDDLGMTGPVARSGVYEAGVRFYGEVVIKNPAHQLAQGLSDVITVTTAPTFLAWGRPGPMAAWVATVKDNPTEAAVFGYEKGAAMVGLVAPARRVGLFLGDDTASMLSQEGWILFEAAIDWAGKKK